MPTVFQFLRKSLLIRELFRKPLSIRKTAPFTTSSGNLSNYEDVYKRSLENPEEFWSEVAQGVEWIKPYERVMDDSNSPFTKWFVGGTLNASYNALDRHISNGRGDRKAIIYESPVTGKKDTLTYNRLKERVARMAGALASLGVRKGDVVLIYMPMIPDVIVGMLAAARIGAVHNIVFGGFAAPELSVRLAHSKAKVILCASVGVEPSKVVYYKPIVDEAISLSPHKPKHCVVLHREGFERSWLDKERDLEWEELEAKSNPHDPVPINSEDPAYILYTSGTTGSPKGIVRLTGGHTVVLPWTMKTIYGMSPNDVWWAASDFGWVVGHSYICYGPLLNGNTTVIYEGKPVNPNAYQFFNIIREHEVKAMFVAPTALRVIADTLTCDEDIVYDTSFQYLYVAGEPLDYNTRVWAEKAFGTPVLDNWWQTETGFPIAAHCMGLNMSDNPPLGAAGKAIMGYNVKVLNDEGEEAKIGELGRIVCKLPLPPCNFSTLFQADDRFKETYFSRYPGYYDTMDAGTIDEEGYISVQGRDDDVINVAGHRFSTIALEEAVLLHEDVTEAAVFGVPDIFKGEIPCCLFVKRKDCMKTEEDLQKEIIHMVRQKIGPVAAFRLCGSVEILPKTRSGKTPRKSFAEIAKDNNIVISPTIEDPSHYKYVVEGLRKLGYAKYVKYPFSKN